jgi:hypothetical protein
MTFAQLCETQACFDARLLDRAGAEIYSREAPPPGLRISRNWCVMVPAGHERSLYRKPFNKITTPS